MSRFARPVALLATAVLAPAALVAAGAAQGATNVAPPKRSAVKPLWQQSQDYWSTLAAPARPPTSASERFNKGKGSNWFESAQQRHATGFPPAARELARREARANARGVSPRRSFKQAGGEPVTHAKLLTLLVEFNPNADDDFSGWERPDDPSDPTGCVTEPPGTLISGPLHNQLPNPATNGTGRDNNTFWVPDFSREHYEQLIYSTEGLTQRVRPDLRGGVDLRGRTVKNHYTEMSKGRYDLGGDAIGWIQVPHSEAYYSADTCDAGPASDVGHPDNPRGTSQMAVDAVEELAKAQSGFPWADYDVEDQTDEDGDGDLFEPNGIVDHLVVVHAGADQADDGGAQESYAEWSSAQAVDPLQGGYQISGTDFKIFNFTTQSEDAGVGVISHEFGHDLGLPDLYDVVGPTETDVNWWSLMSNGSHSGPLFQTIPTHMDAWSKYVLGWSNPKVMPYGSATQTVQLGQASRPPAGTESAVRVNLPDKVRDLGDPHSGENAWFTSTGQNDADVRLTRSIDVPQGSDVRFWSWDDYTIEEFWDYGFIEVSTDGGTTWEELVVRDEAGDVVSTNEDPNGNLENYFGGKKNGLTGDTGGYRHDWVDLTPYAGTTIQLRLRLLTDAAFTERGWFADDFSVTADGETVFSDDVEGGDNGWTATVESLSDTRGTGWVRTNGTFNYEQYYLLEWRNLDGFDVGLKTPYTTNFFVDGEWNVDRTPYNAPGLLIWHRDSGYTQNSIEANTFDAPSLGSKGELLLVDSHYEPERLKGRPAAANPSLTDNLPARQQSMDAAFGRVGRYPFRFCVPESDDPYDLVCNTFAKRAPVLSFTDSKTWYPGIEYRPDLDPESPLFFRDQDASTVIPSRDGEIYSTRVVDRNGRLVRDLFGLPLGGGHVLGTGNPADGRPAAIDGSDDGTTADLSLGVLARIRQIQDGNRRAVVTIRPGHPE